MIHSPSSSEKPGIAIVSPLSRWKIRVIVGLYNRDNGKENGNYYLGFRV